MTRKAFIEAVRRQIYGGQPPSEASVTINLVNNYLNDAIGMAAKANYKDSIAIDGIAYINNSFYTTFKGLAITEEEQFLWKVSLPHIPFGIGTSEGVETLILKDNESRQLSYPFVPLSQNQRSYARGMRAMPNSILFYSEGLSLYIESTLILQDYTAQVTMVSGGNPTDLSSELNVPADYIPIMRDYLYQKFMQQRMSPQDVLNDGSDVIKTA
jgi:hypothetical protein